LLRICEPSTMTTAAPKLKAKIIRIGTYSLNIADHPLDT
jgi:hypothetical protein